ncbi:enoyl-CoA hydratase [Bartonella sp. HY329]|uniref:enoyl-CoA hydratase n=1 Tax=unclassified Bartonella TaxID=2645622 RepID=UPI0021C97F59|nr:MULTISPECIES: enoyl-CoA hydratase [unclassified Bartonella]UXM95448.1 enoyl-CoA hydratase [Bartonella sp. HY329]UXN09773.1 enoyl-CoA hydratase [Bartonella sp. HY328]
MNYETIIIKTYDCNGEEKENSRLQSPSNNENRIGLIQLNRPEALNAINSKLTQEFLSACNDFDKDPTIGCIIISGSQKAFAAGADIKEMQNQSYIEMYMQDWFAQWQKFSNLRTPTIAAISGYALGGGCELAMMCDIILADETAKFGQPEIKLGIMPGMGATQRLTKLIGRTKAMDMCLTGRMMGAEEAERCGLVARIIPSENLQEEALKTAISIASMSRPVAMLAKETIKMAEELSLEQGLQFERRIFHSLFALEDQKEGMAAFVEKRQAEFNHR